MWEPADRGTPRGGTAVERYVRELLRDAERVRRSSRPRPRADAVDAADRSPIEHRRVRRPNGRRTIILPSCRGSGGLEPCAGWVPSGLRHCRPFPDRVAGWPTTAAFRRMRKSTRFGFLIGYSVRDGGAGSRHRGVVGHCDPRSWIPRRAAMGRSAESWRNTRRRLALDGRALRSGGAGAGRCHGLGQHGRPHHEHLWVGRLRAPPGPLCRGGRVGTGAHTVQVTPPEPVAIRRGGPRQKRHCRSVATGVVAKSNTALLLRHDAGLRNAVERPADAPVAWARIAEDQSGSLEASTSSCSSVG